MPRTWGPPLFAGHLLKATLLALLLQVDPKLAILVGSACLSQRVTKESESRPSRHDARSPQTSASWKTGRRGWASAAGRSPALTRFDRAAAVQRRAAIEVGRAAADRSAAVRRRGVFDSDRPQADRQNAPKQSLKPGEAAVWVFCSKHDPFPKPCCQSLTVSTAPAEAKQRQEVGVENGTPPASSGVLPGDPSQRGRIEQLHRATLHLNNPFALESREKPTHSFEFETEIASDLFACHAQ